MKLLLGGAVFFGFSVGRPWAKVGSQLKKCHPGKVKRASGISSSHCCFESLQDCRKGILLISSRCSNYFPNDGIPLFSFAVILHHFRPKNLCNRYSSSIFPTLIVARFFLPMILNTPRILVRAKAYLPLGRVAKPKASQGYPLLELDSARWNCYCDSLLIIMF